MCRRIVIPASSFDSKTKFLDRTRKGFVGGTFTIVEGALLQRYHSFLKEDYKEGKIREYFAGSSIGMQLKGKDYWCLSREVGFKSFIPPTLGMCTLPLCQICLSNAPP